VRRDWALRESLKTLRVQIGKSVEGGETAAGSLVEGVESGSLVEDVKSVEGVEGGEGISMQV